MSEYIENALEYFEDVQFLIVKMVLFHRVAAEGSLNQNIHFLLETLDLVHLKPILTIQLS